jgi:hypothetical protein
LGEKRKSLVAWKGGTMEYWNTGLGKNILFFSYYSIIPLFHYSKTNYSDLKTYFTHLFESRGGR